MSDKNNQDKNQELNDTPSVDEAASTANQGQNVATEFSTGQILTNARLALGVSVEDLAEQIRVPLKVVKQIEADELPTNLPETFVRGYIRAYAKKVGVAESAVLKEIDSMAASSPDAMKMHSFSKRSKRKRIERRLTIITWVIVAVLGIALVAWWVQTKGAEMLAEQTSELTSLTETNGSGQNKDQSTTELEANSIEPETTLGESQLMVQDSATDPEVNTDKTEPSQSSAPRNSVDENTTSGNVSSEPNSSMTNAATLPEQTNEISGVSPEQNDSADLAADEQAPVVLSDAEQRLLADNGEADPEDFMKVEFEFENDCWVEVYDAFDERIAIGNKPAGYLMSLNAQGPFRVLLGNPAGVKIWVNGSPFDMSDLPKNRVARFEVDANL